MEATVDRFVKEHQLIPKGSTVVVGVSGGPDSMALLHYLYKRRIALSINIIACCVDHQLRGEESAEDLLYVQSYCLEYDIVFEGKQVDVHAYKKEYGVNTQVAARKCRYKVFEEVMEKYNANVLALGQHGDDQVETMLMRQVRGSFGEAKAGIKGLRPFAKGIIIRPLLKVTKAETQAYCEGEGIKPRHDPSNDSDTYTRNRFRKYVLPFLKAENPLVHLKFQEDSERMLDDQCLLMDLAKEKLDTVLESPMGDKVRISIERLLTVPVSLQRRVIHLILNYLYRQAHIEPQHQSVHIESIIRWLNSQGASGVVHFPKGLIARRSYDQCVFSFNQKKDIGTYQVELNIPGITKISAGRIVSEIINNDPSSQINQDGFVCDLDQVSKPLYVRTRRLGDRIQPLGMSGTKKVKDLFIDEKVRREFREQWPIVTDQDDDVLWIPLLRRGSKAMVTPSTSVLLKLSFESAADFLE